MAYANGKIPQATLVYVDGVYLEPDTARQFVGARTQIKAETGYTLRPTLPYGGYRDIPTQVVVKRIYGSVAASPGYSNHGLGTAIDITNIVAMPDNLEARARQILAEWGFVFDVKGEGWHSHRVRLVTGGTASSGGPVKIPSTPAPAPAPSTTPAKKKGNPTMFMRREVGGGIFLQTDFGRVPIAQPSHVDLFTRMFSQWPSFDNMLMAELDIINFYVITAQAEFRNWFQASQNSQSDFIASKLNELVAKFPQVDSAAIATKIAASLTNLSVTVNPTQIAAAVDAVLVDNFAAVAKQAADNTAGLTAGLAKVGTVDAVAVADSVIKTIQKNGFLTNADQVAVALAVKNAIGPDLVRLELKNQLK